MKSRALIIIGIAISIGVSFAYAESEKYNLEIIGMKDTYYAGEQLHFDYILSGFGVPCGSTNVSFPDKDGNYVGIVSEELCAAETKNYDFVYDTRINHSSTTATVKIDTPGDYHISIEFERFLRLPVSAIHYFTVLENDVTNNIQIGSYELEESLCMGGPGMLLNDDCVRIGFYNRTTGDETFFPPLKQIKKGIPILDITCNDGLSIGYKKDLSKAICVTPETLFKLNRSDWIFRNTGNPNDPSVYGNDTAILCSNPDDKVVSFGYSVRESDLIVKVSSFERIQYNGLPGALITYDREFDGGMSRGANNGYFPYVHCINESVDSFDDCMNVSHHFSSVNYPIVSCLTLDGKKFSYDQEEAMSKNSGISFYTINYLSSTSLEFVGKTDRVDQEISFSITTPSGTGISTWNEFAPDEIKFAPDESEFRTIITTGGPLWMQEDGIYTLTAKQIDVRYYEAFSEFELKDGKIVR